MVVVSFKEEVMRIAKERVCALTLFVILAGVLSAPAQRLDGDLSGEVKDGHGLAVAGAKVTITNQSQGTKKGLETTDAGTFFVPNLLPGLYKIEEPGQQVGDKERPRIRRLESLFRSEEHTSELQSRSDLVCRLLLEKKKN